MSEHSSIPQVLPALQKQEWHVAPEQKLDSHFTFNARDIRDADWASLATAAVPQLEAGKAPTPEDVAAIFGKYIRGQLQYAENNHLFSEAYYDGLEDENAATKTQEAIDETNEQVKKPLPKDTYLDTLATLRNNLPDKNIDDIEPTGNILIVKDNYTDKVTFEHSTLFPDGLVTENEDLDYEPGNFQLCLEFYKKLPAEDQKELLKQLAPYFMFPASDRHELSMFAKNIFPKNMQDLPAQEKVHITEMFLEELWKKEFDPEADISEEDALDDYHYLPAAREKLSALFKLGLDHEKALHPWMLFLSGKDDFDKIRSHIGNIISPVEFPVVLNSVRDILKDTSLPEANRANMLKLGKLLLGFNISDEAEFYNSLSELYKSIKFENYKLNQESTDYEADIIEAIPGNRTLILGLGTGRHMLELEKRQKDIPAVEKNLYFGLEINDRHVEVARENLEKEQVGDSDHVLHGSWYEIPLDSESVQKVVSNGRDLPHVENKKNAERLRNEVYRVLELGGIFEFDIANPHKGAYVDAKNRVITSLHSLNMPQVMIDYAKQLDIEYILDGPGDSKLYNRYNPSPEQVIELMEDSPGIQGFPFVCTELKRAEIKDGHKSENIYYIAMKPDASMLTPEVRKSLEKYNEVNEKWFQLGHQIIQRQKELYKDINPENPGEKIDMDDYIRQLHEAKKDPKFQQKCDEIESLEAEHSKLGLERVKADLALDRSEIQRQFHEKLDEKKAEIVVKIEKKEKERKAGKMA